MSRTALLTALLGAMLPLVHAKDGEGKAAGSGLRGDAIPAAKAHVRAYLQGDFEKLGRTYAAKVTLMPGHELLKPENGLAGPGGRKELFLIDRVKLLANMKKAHQNRPKRPAGRIDAMLKTLAYEALEVVAGDFVTDPGDPVATPDGKLHFRIEPGDVLVKVAPERDGSRDFLLFHFRNRNGSWQVVAEYLD